MPTDARRAVPAALLPAVSVTTLRRIANALKSRKAKQKAKRDSELLALYRDWPPDLVDEFLGWERRKRYGQYSPSGYMHWKDGMSYADHLRDPNEGVVLVWR